MKSENHYVQRILGCIILITLTLGGFCRLHAERIPAKPKGKNYRVAVVYFKTSDDQFEKSNETKGWSHTKSEPEWKDQLLIDIPFDSSSFQQALKQKPASLTAYFYAMSGGYLWFYGDEVTYTGPPLNRAREEATLSKQKAWKTMNTQILQWFAEQYDLTKLDNNQDNNVDCILFLNRAREKFGFQGKALLEIDMIHTKRGHPRITGSSGIYQTDCYALHATRTLLAHEIGHLLGFGHENGLHRWCLMAGPRFSGVTMSAFEKSRLRWLTHTIVDTTTLNLRLGNLSETNQAIKIPIRDSGDYFVVENRQYHEPFEPDTNHVTHEDYTLPGTGLLVYLVHQNKPYIIPADGEVAKVIENSKVYYKGDDSDLFGNFGKTEITPYTFPSTQTPAVVYTGIAIKNIRKEGKNMIFDIHHHYKEKLHGQDGQR